MDICTITLLNKILGLYEFYDAKPENVEPKESYFEYFTQIIISGANRLTGQDVVINNLKEICQQVGNSINKKDNTGDDWLDLCISLAEKAEIARTSVTFASRSRCHEILHCIRNAIITTMKNDTNYNYQDTYKKRIASLETNLKTAEDECKKISSKEHRTDTDVKEIERLNAEIKKVTLKMVYLENPSMINTAERNGFIAHLIKCKPRHELLKLPQPISYAFEEPNPYVLQPTLLAIHYENHYQQRTKKSFREFCEECNQINENSVTRRNPMQIFVNAYPEKIPPASNLVRLGLYKSLPSGNKLPQVIEKEETQEALPASTSLINNRH